MFVATPWSSLMRSAPKGESVNRMARSDASRSGKGSRLLGPTSDEDAGEESGDETSSSSPDARVPRGRDKGHERRRDNGTDLRDTQQDAQGDRPRCP